MKLYLLQLFSPDWLGACSWLFLWVSYTQQIFSTRCSSLNKMALAARSLYLVKKSQKAVLTLPTLSNLVALRIMLLNRPRKPLLFSFPENQKKSAKAPSPDSTSQEESPALCMWWHHRLSVIKLYFQDETSLPFCFIILEWPVWRENSQKLHDSI